MAAPRIPYYLVLNLQRCVQMLTDAATRGNRALRRRACVLWRGVAKSPHGRSWSSYACEIRASSSGDGGWVGMCASACDTALLTEKMVTRTNPKYTVWRGQPASEPDPRVSASSARLRPAVTHSVHNPAVILICTVGVAGKYFFASNIHEINHSQSVCPRTVQRLGCVAAYSC